MKIPRANTKRLLSAPATPANVDLSGYFDLTANNTATGTNEFTQVLTTSDIDVDGDVEATGAIRGDKVSGYTEAYTRNWTDVEHFRTPFSGTAPGWTMRDSGGSISDRETNWRLLTTSGNNSLAYDRPANTGIPTAPNYNFAYTIRDGAYGADLNHRFVWSASVMGAPSTLDNVCLCMQWNASGQFWQVRGEQNVAGALTVGAWKQLDNFMPDKYYGRIVISASGVYRVYFGYSASSESQFMLLSINNGISTILDSPNNGRWGITQNRGAGIFCYTYIDAVGVTNEV